MKGTILERNMEQTMPSIHKIVKVTNNQIIIDLPPGFASREVEVILKSSTHKSVGIQELEK